MKYVSFMCGRLHIRSLQIIELNIEYRIYQNSLHTFRAIKPFPLSSQSPLKYNFAQSGYLFLFTAPAPSEVQSADVRIAAA